jgi:hypothetical protein
MCNFQYFFDILAFDVEDFDIETFPVELMNFNCVAQWTSHLPQEPKIRVRIQPGCKVFTDNITVLFLIDLICIVFGFTREIQSLATKKY